MRACKSIKRWSGRPGSNRRRPAWEAGILPLNYSRALHATCRLQNSQEFVPSLRIATRLKISQPTITEYIGSLLTFGL